VEYEYIIQINFNNIGPGGAVLILFFVFLPKPAPGGAQIFNLNDLDGPNKKNNLESIRVYEE